MTHIETMIRVIDAWDSTPLPKNKDGRLWQMMEEMRQALEEALANHIPDATKMVSGVKDSLTTQQEQGEPVAWQERQARRMQDGVVTEWTNWYPCRYRTIDEAQAEACDHIPYEWRPLYTTQQQRKPLTEEQLIDLWPSLIMHQHTYAFARAIEAAHGIKE